MFVCMQHLFGIAGGRDEEAHLKYGGVEAWPCVEDSQEGEGPYYGKAEEHLTAYEAAFCGQNRDIPDPNTVEDRRGGGGFV